VPGSTGGGPNVRGPIRTGPGRGAPLLSPSRPPRPQRCGACPARWMLLRSWQRISTTPVVSVRVPGGLSWSGRDRLIAYSLSASRSAGRSSSTRLGSPVRTDGRLVIARTRDAVTALNADGATHVEVDHSGCVRERRRRSGQAPTEHTVFVTFKALGARRVTRLTSTCSQSRSTIKRYGQSGPLTWPAEPIYRAIIAGIEPYDQTGRPLRSARPGRQWTWDCPAHGLTGTSPPWLRTFAVTDPGSTVFICLLAHTAGRSVAATGGHVRCRASIRETCRAICRWLLRRRPPGWVSRDCGGDSRCWSLWPPTRGARSLVGRRLLYLARRDRSGRLRPDPRGVPRRSAGSTSLHRLDTAPITPPHLRASPQTRRATQRVNNRTRRLAATGYHGG